MAEFLIIEHKDGRRVAVLPKDFERNKDGQFDGFKATTFEDGSAYEPPAPKDATKAADEKKGGA